MSIFVGLSLLLLFSFWELEELEDELEEESELLESEESSELESESELLELEESSLSEGDFFLFFFLSSLFIFEIKLDKIEQQRGEDLLT